MGRDSIAVGGWTLRPGADFAELRFARPWDSRLKEVRTGVAYNALETTMAGGTDSRFSSFSVVLGLPALFRKLRFEIVFDDGCVIEVRSCGEANRELFSRWWRNLGHFYLGWAKPLKRRVLRRRRDGASDGVRPCREGLRQYDAAARGGEVILPIHNGLRYLEVLLPKLCEDAAVTKLFLIDDASTDGEVVMLLEAAAVRFPKVELIRNETNAGFVVSANMGLRRISGDCVLLNSDVDVPPGWVERLLEPIRRDASVASTTPFTNAGTILSFPEWLVDNEVFSDLSVATIDAEFAKLRAVHPLPELPTGVGFCMGLSRRAIEETGLLDEESFGRGYGEENDWCQRAIAKGFRNVPVVDLYVQHEHGGSYSSEAKERLLAKNLAMVVQKHPSYPKAIAELIAADPLRGYREVARLLVLANCASSGVCLVFDHEEGGGANLFREHRTAAMRGRGEVPIVVRWNGRSGNWELIVEHPRWSGSIEREDVAECLHLTRGLAVRQIMINSLVFARAPVALLKEIALLADALPGAEMEVFLHDYHALCPSHTLLDARTRFCDLPGREACAECLQTNPRAEGGDVEDIETWRGAWREVLGRAHRIRAFSAVSAGLFRRVYPEFEGRLEVRGHDSPAGHGVVARAAADFRGEPVVAVIGNIGASKGAEVVMEVARRGLCEVVVVGQLAPGLDPGSRVTVHGSYRHEELPSLMDRYRVTICLVPSIWPETYNFVADEIMNMELPVICFDIGAHAERIAGYRMGKVLPLSLAEDADNLAREIAKFQAELAEGRVAVAEEAVAKQSVS